jgi:sarcosine oxidase subunit alpha
VFTARALQILLNLYRVRPGRHVVVLGDGAEAEEVAADVALAGGSVVARVTPDRLPGLAAQGVGGVEVVTIGDERYEAEVVAIAVGRQPDLELALMAECAAGYAEALGGWTPLRDRHMQTTTPGIFVCGDAAGTCDVRVALAEGALAGLAAAATLDLVDPGSVHLARSAYEAVAVSRIHVAESLTSNHVQVERVSAEAGV